jgi:hypothetical protein
MFVKKDYHLLPKINDIIRRISESGLLNVWLEASQMTKLGEHAGVGRRETVPLSVNHVQGAFILGGIGTMAALMSFIAEWFVFWLSHKRKNKFFRKYVESVFCYNPT